MMVTNGCLKEWGVFPVDSRAHANAELGTGAVAGAARRFNVPV